MCFGQTLADLFGQTNHSRGLESSLPSDDALQIFAAYILHGDVVKTLVFTEVIQAADVSVGYPTGDLELVPEAIDGLRMSGDFWPKDFESNFLTDLLVHDTIDFAHAPAAKGAEDLISRGEGTPLGRLRREGFECMGFRLGGLLVRNQHPPALDAETAPFRVVGMAFQASHGSLQTSWKATNVPTFGDRFSKRE
jgi:hypothetical protein